MCSVEVLTDEKTLSAVQLRRYLGESLQPIFYPLIYTDLFSCSKAGATFSLLLFVMFVILYSHVFNCVLCFFDQIIQSILF